MRFATQAYRIRYGICMISTFSPDEGLNLLMIRLSRRNDPVIQNKYTKHLSQFCASDMPDLNASSEDVVLDASVEEMANNLPCHDARKRILATDVLASVNGFRAMVQLTFQHLWGIDFCQNCPDSNTSATPCQDLFGSSATSEGYIDRSPEING